LFIVFNSHYKDYFLSLILNNFKIDSAIFSAAQEVSFLAMTGFENKSFSLLWRGSRDGFDVAAFHRLCDGQGNTVTVIKNNNGYIFGGFTLLSWNSIGGVYQADNSAFLFSLSNPSNTPLKLKVKPAQSGVYHHSSFGPIFGTGHDLLVNNLSNTNRQNYMNLSSYEFPNAKSGSEGGQFIVLITNFKLLKLKFFKFYNLKMNVLRNCFAH